MLLNYIKYTQEKIEPGYYPDVRELQLDTITDESLADYFGFTKEEREAIKVVEYPKVAYKMKEISCSELKKETAGGSYEQSRKRFAKTRKVHRS